MTDVVIRAERLGKKYLIGHQAERERYTTLRDVLVRQAKGLSRSARDLLSGRHTIAGDHVEEFWALKDVDFEIRRGDVVGMVGRNGAGKSTLLKILSRITEPSEGRVTIKGRVASLLEVGTGFHPELTGRENIYLNGAILGMTRAEIRSKFDEIVDFANIEKFLDTPVKRYSSGMYVRLAFAVAAHLEPEILVVDEVLAVGDAEFQKKCIGKMKDVSTSGRTIILVSHNVATIADICTVGVLMEKGRIADVGSAKDVAKGYLQSDRSVSYRFDRETDEIDRRVNDGAPAIVGLSLDSQPVFNAAISGTLRFFSSRPLVAVAFGVGFCNQYGTRVLTIDSDYPEPSGRFDLPRPGFYDVRFSLESLPLGPDTYSIEIGSRSGTSTVIDHVRDALLVEVRPAQDTPPFLVNENPSVRLPSAWVVSAV